MKMEKVNKTEQEIQESMQRVAQEKQYQAFKVSMKKEIEDNTLRVEWLRVKKELDELSKWYAGEGAKEKDLTKNIIDTILVQFKLEDKKEEMYKFFQIPLPKIEVGNIEDKKEEPKLETIKTE
jgi:hypothetical protein